MTGDQRRFEALYQEYHGPVLGYVLRRTESAGGRGGRDRRDVRHRVAAPGRRPTGEQARLWLYGVARRTLANHRRSQRRRSSLADRLRAELAAAHGPAEYTRGAGGGGGGVRAALGRRPRGAGARGVGGARRRPDRGCPRLLAQRRADPPASRAPAARRPARRTPRRPLSRKENSGEPDQPHQPHLRRRGGSARERGARWPSWPRGSPPRRPAGAGAGRRGSRSHSPWHGRGAGARPLEYRRIEQRAGAACSRGTASS